MRESDVGQRDVMFEASEEMTTMLREDESNFDFVREKEELSEKREQGREER